MIQLSDTQRAILSAARARDGKPLPRQRVATDPFTAISIIVDAQSKALPLIHMTAHLCHLMT